MALIVDDVDVIDRFELFGLAAKFFERFTGVERLGEASKLSGH